MRNGRPCSCGCATCTGGYACSSGIASTGCTSVQTYGFFDDFSTTNSGWIYDRFTATGGVGVPSGNGYVFDAVSGVNFSDWDCTLIRGATTFYHDSVTGYGSISLDNLSVTANTNGNIDIVLPNGSGYTVSSSFRTGDNLFFRISTERVPPNYKRQFISIYRLSRSNGCSSPEIDSTYPPDPGGGGSGCPFYACQLYKGLFSEVPEDVGQTLPDPYYPSENHTYAGSTTVSTSGNFIVAESGGLTIDDVCFQGEKGERPEGFIYFTNESCGRYLRPRYWEWDYPCTKFFGPYDPTHSGINEIYLTFAAYRDGYIGCDLDPPDSGTYAHLRVHIKEYDVDLLKPDIFVIVPVGSRQTLYPLEDSTPFDGSGGPNYYIRYSGIPCRQGYSPPFLNYDNSLPYCYTGSLAGNRGNLSNIYDSGTFSYLQAGTDYFLENAAVDDTDLPLETDSSNIDLDPIPREDTYARPNYYVSLGSLVREGSGGPFWSVDKRAYYINWDSSKQYWYGEFQFLSASGGGDTSTLSSLNPFQNFDFSLPFTSGEATQTLDFYLQQECGGGVSKTFLIDSSGNYYGGNDDLLDYTTRYSFPIGASCALGTSFLFTGHCDYPYTADGEGSSLGMPQIIYQKEIDCVDCSGCSGVLTYGLNTMCGYYLNATDFSSGVPPFFIDTKGYVITRPTIKSNLLDTNSVGADGFTQIFHNATMGGGLLCPTISDNHAIYELTAGDTVSLSYPVTDSKTLMDMTPSENGPISMMPVYVGFVNGNIKSSGDSFPSPYNIMCSLVLFADYQNDTWRAFLTPSQDCTDMPFYLGYNLSQEGYHGFFKYGQDFVNKTYFADIEVLSSNPMRFKITQSFTSRLYGSSPIDCEDYVSETLQVQTIIEEPTIGIK